MHKNTFYLALLMLTAGLSSTVTLQAAMSAAIVDARATQKMRVAGAVHIAQNQLIRTYITADGIAVERLATDAEMQAAYDAAQTQEHKIALIVRWQFINPTQRRNEVLSTKIFNIGFGCDRETMLNFRRLQVAPGANRNEIMQLFIDTVLTMLDETKDASSLLIIKGLGGYRPETASTYLTKKEVLADGTISMQNIPAFSTIDIRRNLPPISDVTPAHRSDCCTIS